jgi:hypothetical protein
MTASILREYGRAEMTRSCARRSLAAATIFMVLVICWVFLTLVIFLRMSRKLGMPNPYS